MKAEPILVRICAWCPDNRERTQAATDAGREVTHGICPTHAKEFEAA